MQCYLIPFPRCHWPYSNSKLIDHHLWDACYQPSFIYLCCQWHMHAYGNRFWCVGFSNADFQSIRDTHYILELEVLLIIGPCDFYLNAHCTHLHTGRSHEVTASIVNAPSQWWTIYLPDSELLDEIALAQRVSQARRLTPPVRIVERRIGDPLHEVLLAQHIVEGFTMSYEKSVIANVARHMLHYPGATTKWSGVAKITETMCTRP